MRRLVWEKENSEFKPVKLRLKIDLVSYPARAEGLVNRASMVLFTNPSARAGYDTRSIFKRSLTGLNSEFSFSQTSCLTKAEENSLPYYLPIAGGRGIGFIPFPRVLVLCEMQSVSSMIWTGVTVSTSYDDNHYTTGTIVLDMTIKKSDGEAPSLELWGIWSTLHCHCSQVHSDPEW